jgi:hypothetical protein
MDDILDNIFNKDLTFKNGYKFNNFDEKKEFKLDVILQKISKVYNNNKLNDINYTDFVCYFDDTLIDLIIKFVNENTDITEKNGMGSYFDKCIIFLSCIAEFKEIRENIKKKS